ncbi:C45 family autoproteolytic acyltransferase/hydolase [Methylovirgula sp. 4M-Z18]|uniref:C45 family autoproteolytic acyltransferase/hydolase n=1 Tax=Methylovirgula sp. 4M-Z18 TaxID=2293567 RepID=UPI000E2F8E71|nr:C45 family autoproteolytic acyltransferase/hydolase [Methylovirgula sp. 4M-Z18]RFB78558.1 peptidase C45 [Methylovirgula sp. 4M-Z18]
MLKTFVAAIEDQPGAEWLSRFQAGRHEAAHWYTGGHAALITPKECRDALRAHMPELLPRYDHACDLVGDDDLAHCIISHYRPAPMRHGCSQAVWLGREGPALIRNFDYPLPVISDRIEMTRWFGNAVICKAQRPWGGCLDGMNAHGLVGSITMGGNLTRGLGFSVLLMLRYVLETCRNVEEATKALIRIPIAQAQNVTLLDRSGLYCTLFLGPRRDPAITLDRVCTNHQEGPGRGSSALRKDRLLHALAAPAQTLDGFCQVFLQPPLHARKSSFTTAYTAVYRPGEGRVDFIWPEKRWSQSFAAFTPGEYRHDYGELAK